MDAKLLIDSIVQQTTVLIAQLSTAAGVRAPLSHVADQVFVQLAKEIEAQGVGRKVVADMFGLALRTYQRKVQRLTEGATIRDKTLWEAVVAFVEKKPQSRVRIRERFRHDGEEHVGAVLNDLVSSGLVYCTGRGDFAVFGLASEEAQDAVLEKQDDDSLANLIWLCVFRRGSASPDELQAEFSVSAERLQRSTALLLGDGRLREHTRGIYRASNIVLPLGLRQGWEAAVFDHFNAVAQAIAGKLRLLERAGTADTVGGATVTLTVHPLHPRYDEVVGLLRQTRQRMDALYEEVSAFNTQHDVPEQATVVRFYFGQTTQVGALPGNTSDENAPNSTDAPAGVSALEDEL